MIQIALSERDFDYELQALVGSFFSGIKCQVILMSEPEAAQAAVRISLGHQEIIVQISFGTYQKTERVTVSGEGDFHKHEDKSSHPYRTYYKNELKRLVFLMLRDIPDAVLPIGWTKSVPEWGTMTGVRPTKIPMSELLSGKSEAEVRDNLKKWYQCAEEKLELCLSIALTEAQLLQDISFEGGYSLYIGIPFCPTTCLYCSFPSYPYAEFGHLSEAYLEALCKEIHETAKQCSNHELTSIYMGGGTPTALSAEQLDQLLSCVENSFPVTQAKEYTVEAGRPDSITREKLEVLRKHGIDRISVNPQTMQQKTLDLIGRKHTVEDTRKAFLLARELGFTNINMDLIIGLPDEDLADYENTLEQIKELGPDSLTVHSLVIKRASRLRSVLETVGTVYDETLRTKRMAEMLVRTQDFVKMEGYKPYYMYRQKNSSGHSRAHGQENIGYAKPGKECLYNILMMEEVQTVIAVGAGASTKRYDLDKKIVSRVENVKSITDYIGRIDEMIDRKQGVF